MADGRPLFELSTQRCPVCDGQGELIFCTCTQCGLVTLGCAEEGSVFANLRELTPTSSVPFQSPCWRCEAPFGKYRPSTPEEIRGAGFSEAEFRSSHPTA